MTATAPLSPDRPVAGVLWMLVTGVLFVAVTALVKALGPGVPAPQSAFLRFAFGTLMILPFAGGLLGPSAPGRGAMRLFLARGLAHTGAVVCWFFAMARLPIAEVTALNYLSPVYVTLGAALLLGEGVRLRRFAAVGVALAGAFVILRPGFRELSAGHAAMLATGLGLGISYLIGKRMTTEAGAAEIVAMLSLVVTLLLAPFALAVWVPVGLRELGILALVAALATAAHFTMTLAFRAAPVGVTQPVAFLQLVWAALLGWVLFDEAVDPFVIGGGTAIVGAVSFIAWREHVAARAGRAVPGV